MAQLDHVVILLPHAAVQSIPECISSKFTVSPGNRAGHGKTENKWIILRDGTMFELVAYVDDDPKRKDGHFWGLLPTGIVDMTWTSARNGDIEPVRAALRELNAPITYGAPRVGGRPRAGLDPLQFSSTWPEKIGGGTSEPRVERQFPFWTHDFQDREFRAACSNKAVSTHPSGAIGVKEMAIGVPRSKLREFIQIYEVISGKKAQGSKIVLPTPRGGALDLVIEPFDEEYARILSVKILTEKPGKVQGLNESFDGGNILKMDFVTEFGSKL